jgi:hypothetical protein
MKKNGNNAIKFEQGKFYINSSALTGLFLRADKVEAIEHGFQVKGAFCAQASYYWSIINPDMTIKISNMSSMEWKEHIPKGELR